MVRLQKSEDFGVLQEFVDGLFASDPLLEYSRLEIILEAEAFGFCSQLNSSLSSHGWGYLYGAVH